MKIAIFGSTGVTGLCTVASALKLGHEITAFVRDPSLLSPESKPQRVVQGDVLNASDVDSAVKDQDAVIIVLGTRNQLEPTTMMSEGTKNILNAMKKFEVKKVSCCLSSFMFWDREKVPARLANVHEDHERMLQCLKDSDRQWIGVCPPHIADSPPTGNYILENDKPVGRAISKHDLGKILVECLEDDSRVFHLVAMGYPTQ